MVTREKILQTMNSWQWGEVIAVCGKKCSGASSRSNMHGHEAWIASVSCSRPRLLRVWERFPVLRSRAGHYCGDGERWVGIVYGFQDSSANVPSDDCQLLFMAIVKKHRSQTYVSLISTYLHILYGIYHNIEMAPPDWAAHFRWNSARGCGHWWSRN